MKLFGQKTPSSAAPVATGTSDFDLLRARLEVEVDRPSVIAITSSTADDGKEIAARGLAQSLAATGYLTLFIDTAPSATRGLPKPAPGLTLEGIATQMSPDSGIGHLTSLTLGDAALQKTTSQRNIRLALEIFRGKFDYVVINAGQGLATSFASSIVAAADAVLVTVKTGRREKTGDARLADGLKRLGTRFLGVVAIDPSILKNEPNLVAVSSGFPDLTRSQAPVLEKERLRREVADGRLG